MKSLRLKDKNRPPCFSSHPLLGGVSHALIPRPVRLGRYVHTRNTRRKVSVHGYQPHSPSLAYTRRIQDDAAKEERKINPPFLFLRFSAEIGRTRLLCDCIPDTPCPPAGARCRGKEVQRQHQVQQVRVRYNTCSPKLGALSWEGEMKPPYAGGLAVCLMIKCCTHI